MKHILAFEKKSEVEKYERMVKRFKKQLSEYQKLLEEEYVLVDQPKAVVWTSATSATTVFSELPIPAFTNKDLIYITPDLEEWQKLFFRQLEGRALPEIRKFYEELSNNFILAILGHELTHHSDLFLDEFGDERQDGIWFEEGMCEYLSRKHLLTEKEFLEIALVEQQLVDEFQESYGHRPIDDFGSSSYEKDLSSIFFDYWRSFLSIKYLVEERYGNDVQSVFRDYHSWHKEGRKLPLTEFFGLVRENSKEGLHE